ncbi:MAG TPA: saccharopine dehydrogenase C-terminal domain-containing protein [Chitinophagaceae bacterium]
MRKILLFGAGKSATVLIDYLLKNALTENWQLTLVDANLDLARSKLGNAVGGKAVSFDINSANERRTYIKESDIVISLLPPTLHILVARDCIHYKKNLLTASYVDEQLKQLREEIEKNDILFLCEMGLDPGIDHMSAKKMIDEIEEEDGVINSFMSHCGGLVAPESDNNPWRYKISWNPKNVVLAGKAGAIYKQNGDVKEMSYPELFVTKRFVDVPGLEPLCWYPNRDSLSYTLIYGLEDCPTFIRTTLRHPDFIYGWKNIIELNLTDEEFLYDTDGKSLMAFFQEHMERMGFGNWLHLKMQEQFESSKKILQDLVNLVEMEEKAEEAGTEPLDEFMVVNESGSLQQVDLEEIKTNAAATVAFKMHEAKLTLKQLFYLGMDDDKTMINKGKCTAADVLQFALEKKLPLLKDEKDMVVMVHEIEYRSENTKYKETSTLLVKGEDDQHTAMAKTVGLPLAIATKLILNGVINTKGLKIPVTSDIYLPVLEELEENGIVFSHIRTKVE